MNLNFPFIFLPIRLKDEVNRLQENVQENQQLNNTLQLELSVYDKMHDENKSKGNVIHNT